MKKKVSQKSTKLWFYQKFEMETWFVFDKEHEVFKNWWEKEEKSFRMQIKSQLYNFLKIHFPTIFFGFSKIQNLSALEKKLANVIWNTNRRAAFLRLKMHFKKSEGGNFPGCNRLSCYDLQTRFLKK